MPRQKRASPWPSTESRIDPILAAWTMRKERVTRMGGMMRRPLLAALISLGLGAMPALADPAKSLLFQIQERGTLRVGMTGDYQPMTFRDPATGNFEGHQVDAARELAKDLGVEV